MAVSSFDIVSSVDPQEVKNAVQQTTKEVRTRFDFKGSTAAVEETTGGLVLSAESDGRVRSLRQILDEKLARRKVSMKALQYDRMEVAPGGSARQKLNLQQGLSSEQARDIVKRIKATKLKVQAAIQGDQVRVSGKKRDDLQAIMAMLKEADLPFDWRAANYR